MTLFLLLPFCKNWWIQEVKNNVMAKQFELLKEEHIEFISEQKMFFVATAMADGRVNLSPKGMDSLRILGPNQLAWLNLTGSGNESAAHILQNPRMTIMLCAFEGKPLILRMYGIAKALHPYDDSFVEYASLFPTYAGTRQIFLMEIDLVQTSCGYAVPFYDYQSERTTLEDWAEKQGEDRIKAYWEEKNQRSIDGAPSHIIK